MGPLVLIMLLYYVPTVTVLLATSLLDLEPDFISYGFFGLGAIMADAVHATLYAFMANRNKRDNGGDEIARSSNAV
ncbi:MAG: hypothetical protein JXA38_00245 [Methanosarcinaceae archaeon]|nr:hypothetical protein [Methanosarcinaceae archaeon]